MGEFAQGAWQGEQPLRAAIDVKLAIELVGKLDDGTGIARARRRELEFVVAEDDGVVGGDGPLITEAEAAREIEAAWQTAEVGCGLARRDGEALVEVGGEAVEDVIGLIAGGGAGEAKLADQPILKGAPEAFDAALGLRRLRGNLLDAEFLEGATDLSRKLLAGEFFGDGPVGIIALENGVAIAVEAEGDAVTGEQLLQQPEVAERVLGFELEMGGEDAAGGVILEAE